MFSFIFLFFLVLTSLPFTSPHLTSVYNASPHLTFKLTSNVVGLIMTWIGPRFTILVFQQLSHVFCNFYLILSLHVTEFDKKRKFFFFFTKEQH